MDTSRGRGRSRERNSNGNLGNSVASERMFQRGGRGWFRSCSGSCGLDSARAMQRKKPGIFRLGPDVAVCRVLRSDLANFTQHCMVILPGMPLVGSDGAARPFSVSHVTVTVIVVRCPCGASILVSFNKQNNVHDFHWKWQTGMRSLRVASV